MNTKLVIATWLLWAAVAVLCRAAVTDGLVAYYRFENNYLDTSGSANVNDGTPVNPSGFTTGKMGKGMSLLSTRDYLTLDPHLLTDLDFGSTTDGTAVDFSIAMWVKPTTSTSDPAILSNKNWNSGSNTGINWAQKVSSQPLDLNLKGDTGVRQDLDGAGNSAPLLVGSWNLLIMTVDRDGPTNMYINGVNTGTIPLTSQGDFDSGLPWNVGQDGTGSYAVDFTGVADELAFWRRAITPLEAAAIWNGGSGVDLLTLQYDQTLKLVVDRDTGQMAIVNHTAGNQDIKAYSVISPAGTLDSSAWTTVRNHYDSVGDKSVDVDDRWIVFSSPGSVADLSEGSLDTGTLAFQAEINLGAGVWDKYYDDSADLAFVYLDGTGALVEGAVEFTGNGGTSFPFADLDFNGTLNARDWRVLQSRFGSTLTGKSTAQRYRLADLNSDGQHTLSDILAFRLAYDSVHGSGAFAVLTTAVPEPSSVLLMLGLVGVVALSSRRTLPQSLATTARLTAIAIIGCTLQAGSHAAHLFQEDFDSVALGPNIDEGTADATAWSNVPPAGWSIDNSGVPAGGIVEWSGWAFADPTWWATTAADQGRSQFTKGTGVVAVADPDEWDDKAHDPGLYHTFLQTPAISLAGVAANTAQLRFDSSWLPEDTQTATLTVSYDGGADQSVFRWASEVLDPDYKAGATNETVFVDLNNPTGAAYMEFKFGMVDAGNDWWWAIDNLLVFSPLTLQVNVSTGEISILANSSQAVTAYEISSPEGSLNPSGWLTGNLDSQSQGGSGALADFDQSGTVDGGDLDLWASAYDASSAADADLDGDSDGRDFLSWQRGYGTTASAEDAWLTFLATDRQLIESYLAGSTTFTATTSLGLAYDLSQDLRDLQFTYTTGEGELMKGAVVYVGTGVSTLAAPEPSTAGLLLSVVLLGFTNARRVGLFAVATHRTLGT